jgi:uncharacterized Zn finger protein
MARSRYRRFSRPLDLYENFPVQLSASERKRRAQKQIAKLTKKGRVLDPVTIEGRAIADSFWGQAWCENLEAYSDYETRLPRGRSYLRSGAVLDLKLVPGRIDALVQGTDLYQVSIQVDPLASTSWQAIVRECHGGISSLVELLRGKLSDRVMSIVTRRPKGLFPAPNEIRLACSCPDHASMCKHVAAVLYGIGARLDLRPELLFVLRNVEPGELVASAPAASALVRGAARRSKRLDGDLSSIFGIEITDRETAPRRKRHK